MPMWDDQGSTEEGHIRRLGLLDMVRRIRPRLHPYRGTLLLAVVLMLLSVVTDLASPLILRRLIDGVIPAAMKDGQIGGILLTAGLYLGLFLVGAAASYAQALLVARMGLSLVTRLKRDTFEHLLNLGMDYFDANPPGRLMARVESDAERLQMLFSEVALAMARSSLLLTGTLTVMFISGWKITLGLVGLLLPVVIGGLFFLGFLRRVYATVRRLYARLTTFVTEYVQAVPVLQVFGRTTWTMEKLRAVNRERYNAEKRAAFFEYGFWSFFFSLEVVAVMMILRLGFGASAVVAGMTLGTLVLFVEYTRRLFFPLLMFAEQIQFLQRAFASADRVFGILSTESTVADAPGTLDHLPRDWKTLTFDHVTFDYAGGSRALEDVSFTVRRGETVALAGPSGGGKTTVTSLLLRFYEPSSGAIRLDGVDIRGFSLSAWREAIGLVLQDIHLFPGTVGDNLRVFADGIPDERLAGAVSSLGADEILTRLSKGLGTDLAEGGQNLSMGERQLISFARALVRDPQILILDEATSSVDPGTERKLQESVERLRHGRTSLVVAHRLSTITAADRILVLQRGHLVEEGTHRELYERDGIYRGLFDLQFEAGEVVS